MRFWAGLLTAAVILAPAAATAGDVGCVWRALPESFRTAAFKAYAEERVGDLLLGASEEVLGKAIVKCVALPDNKRGAEKTAEAVGLALAAYAIQLGSEAYLFEKVRIDATTLERAYGTVEPKRRKDFATMYLNPGREPPKAVILALLGAMRAAYDAEIDPDSPEFDQLYMYFTSRALREQNEAKF